MKWYSWLVIITFLISLATMAAVIVIMVSPTTFPSINNQIRDQALAAVMNSPVITSLVNEPRSEIWTTLPINSSMISLHANNGAALSINLTLAGCKFTFKKWKQIDYTYIQTYFQLIATLRDVPLANVTDLTLHMKLPEPALAQNLTPLLGACTISGVTISDQHVYTTIPQTDVCLNVTCDFEISPTVTLNSTPIEFNGYLLYTVAN